MAIEFKKNKPAGVSSSGEDVIITGEGDLKLSADSGTEVGGAVEINDRQVCIITTASLTLEAGEIYEIVLSSNIIFSDSVILPAIRFGSATQGLPVALPIIAQDGSATIRILNASAQADTADVNGTLVITLIIFNL